LLGSEGADALWGGRGVDLLSGGSNVSSDSSGSGDWFLFNTFDTGDEGKGRADTIKHFEESDTIWLQGSYSFVGATTPDDGQYGIWNDGTKWIVTYNSVGDSIYHDIIVFGADPTNNIEFF
jgi:hypothetical protein